MGVPGCSLVALFVPVHLRSLWSSGYTISPTGEGITGQQNSRCGTTGGMMMNDLIEKYKIKLFWFHGVEVVPIGDLVAIHEIVTEVNGDTFVTFRCLARRRAKDFINNHRVGEVYARYEPMPDDNPHSGIKLFTISKMKRDKAWVKEATLRLGYDQPHADELEFYIKNKCHIEMHFLLDGDDGEQD